MSDLSEQNIKALDEISLRFIRTAGAIMGKQTAVDIGRALRPVLGDAWAGRIVFEVLASDSLHCSVVLYTVPRDEKINAIKIVRNHTGWGLGETKAEVEKVMHDKFGSAPGSPNTIVLRSPEDARALYDELQQIGCSVGYA